MGSLPYKNFCEKPYTIVKQREITRLNELISNNRFIWVVAYLMYKMRCGMLESNEVKGGVANMVKFDIEIAQLGARDFVVALRPRGGKRVYLDGTFASYRDAVQRARDYARYHALALSGRVVSG